MARRIPWFLLLLFACAPVVPAVQAQLVATPRARSLPVSPSNRPFLAAASAERPVDLAPLGYAESELLVSGYGSIYEWSGPAAAAEVSVRAGDIPWATRILVRRPVDPAKASGFVVVELLNPTAGFDAAPMWGHSWQHFTRRGDVWVGVTVAPSSAAALRRFDPVRYGSLSFAYRQAPGCAGTADTEDGLAFDIIAQVGTLLRSSSKENPLLDLNPWKIVATGHSRTGAYVNTYANALHRVLRRGDGAPIYDGYLNASGGYAPLNQCAGPLPEDDPRQAALPRDVPFVTVATEADLAASLALRRDDSDEAGDQFRLFEVPGSGHVEPAPAGDPAEADLKRIGMASPFVEGQCVEPRASFPLGLAYDAIWQQYADWLTSGVLPARVPRIETAADGTPLRDAQGNARGGWRLPQLDVAVARHIPRRTLKQGGDTARINCTVLSGKEPFDAARLKALYRNRAGYQQAFRAAVAQAVQERRLTAADGEALKAGPLPALPAF